MATGATRLVRGSVPLTVASSAAAAVGPPAASSPASSPARASATPPGDGRSGDGERRCLELRRDDARVIAMLFALPALLLALPAAAGYPLMTGDAVLQNYPLRVLAGEAIVAGHLPLYDPYLFGGAPLLGGLNAGAAFPDVVLFGLLPHLAAWVVVEVLAFGGAGCGLYLFLRGNRLSPLPSCLGAVTYGLGGFLSSQAVHLDVVETGACLAWVLLALERLAHAPRRARPAWAAVLAAAAGCVALAASPEVAFDATVAALAYALHLLWRDGRPARLAGWFLAGGLCGALLGAVQITTGSATVASSQRGHVDVQFLTSGTVGRQLVLLLAPHVLGGGPIGLEPYVGSYNLAELDAYTGVVALCCTAYLAACPRRAGASRWRVFYAVAALGLAIAASGRIGIARLLAALPVIGESRLPSRALLLWSLATAVLLAYGSAELLEPGSVTPEPGRGAWARRRVGASRPPDRPRATPALSRRDLPARLVALVPPLAVLGLVGAFVAGGRTVAVVLAQQPVGPWSLAAVSPYLACCVLLAIGAATLVLSPRRRCGRPRRGLLVGLVVADLLVFSADQSSLAPVPAAALASTSRIASALEGRLGTGGRFLVVDPARSGGLALDELGAPNLDILHGTLTAQGYGSLVWAPYEAATGTHGQDVVAPAALAGATFDELDVRALLVVPGDFTTPVSSRASARTVLRLDPGASLTRLFGGSLDLDALLLRPATGGAPGAARALAGLAGTVRLLGAGGSPLRTAWRVERSESWIRLQLPRPVQASALRLGLRSGAGATAVTVTLFSARARRPVLLGGPLSSDVTPPHWRLAGSLGPYAVLADSRADGPYRLEGRRGAAAVGSLRVLSQSRFTGATRVLVRAPAPVELLRSVADLPGWSASLATAGVTRPLPIGRAGVVEKVALPRGRDVVTFTYTPPGYAIGVEASGAGAVLLAALGAWGLCAGWAGRRRKGADATGLGGIPRRT